MLTRFRHRHLPSLTTFFLPHQPHSYTLQRVYPRFFFFFSAPCILRLRLRSDKPCSLSLVCPWLFVFFCLLTKMLAALGSSQESELSTDTHRTTLLCTHSTCSDVGCCYSAPSNTAPGKKSAKVGRLLPAFSSERVPPPPLPHPRHLRSQPHPGGAYPHWLTLFCLLTSPCLCSPVAFPPLITSPPFCPSLPSCCRLPPALHPLPAPRCLLAFWPVFALRSSGLSPPRRLVIAWPAVALSSSGPLSPRRRPAHRHVVVFLPTFAPSPPGPSLPCRVLALRHLVTIWPAVASSSSGPSSPRCHPAHRHLAVFLPAAASSPCLLSGSPSSVRPPLPALPPGKRLLPRCFYRRTVLPNAALVRRP